MASINEKLSYINDIKILLKENINKINNVLTDNSTFRNYSQELFNGYLDVLNNGTDTLWNNLEKVSASGEEVTLENVETAPMKIEISGNISQDGEPTPDYPQQVKVVKGENVVSVSGNRKNYIDLTKHTNTLDSKTTVLSPNSYQCDLNGSWKGLIDVPIENLKPNTDYTISASTKSSATYSIISWIRGYNGEEYTSLKQNIYFNYFKNGNTFNSGEYDRYEMRIFIVGNQARTGIEKLEDLQIEEGTTKTDFVPYTRTDYHIDLVAENIFDKDDYEYLTGYIANTSGDNYGRLVRNNNTTDVVVYVKTKPNTIYIVKKILVLPNDRSRFRLAVYSTKPITQTFDMPTIYNVTNDTATEQIINTGNDGNYLYIQVYTSNTTTPLEEVLDSLEIRELNPIYEEMCEEDYFYKQNDKWYIHKGFGKATDESGSASITINDMVSDAKIYSYYGGTVSGNTITYDEAISDTNYIYYPLQTPTEEEITNSTLIEQLEAIFKAKSIKDKTYITQTNDELPFIINANAILKNNN